MTPSQSENFSTRQNDCNERNKDFPSDSDTASVGDMESSLLSDEKPRALDTGSQPDPMRFMFHTHAPSYRKFLSGQCLPEIDRDGGITRRYSYQRRGNNERSVRAGGSATYHPRRLLCTLWRTPIFRRLTSKINTEMNDPPKFNVIVTDSS